MKYTMFHEQQFRAQVEKALDSVQTVLDVNRKPRLAEDMDHKYDDKYALAEFLTNTTIAAQMNILERLGLTEDKLKRLYDMVHVDKRSVTISFEAEDTCTFLKEQLVDVVSHNVEHVVESAKTSSGGLFGASSSSQKSQSVKHKVIQKVREHHWKVGTQYRIICYAGNDPDKKYVDLLSRASSTTIVTTGSKEAPFPQRTVHDPVKTSFTWLLQNITKESDKQQRTCGFKIDRTKETCRTPRRNEEIEQSIAFFNDLSFWFIEVKQHFIKCVEGRILGKHNPANEGAQHTKAAPMLSTVSDSQLFCPVAPLLESSPQEVPGSATRQEQPRSLLVLTSGTTGSSSSPLMSLGDIDKLLNEQCRTLDDTMAELTSVFPSHQLMKLVTIAEASIVFFSLGASSLFKQYQQSIEYIEEMLRKQLIAAIGKEVQPKDFQEFMKFHDQKLFAPQFAPKPFSYAIRRPNHYPYGIISIEGSGNDGKVEPINTHVRFLPGEDAPAMSIPINAATTIQMTGDRYLHGWINHRFGSSSTGSFTLSARARQFSSFLLIVGVMAGADQFSPKDAIIVQNKDEVLLPLLLNELPTAKEFKDAIVSLSPEQQRFATSFRGMQLESSVFGVCVIQLKPQMEALLGLPPDALTKEIRLTQDLMSLFVDYQIPSDLLSFDGSCEASVKDKVDCVKGHTKAVLDVIADAKKAELEDMEQIAKHHVNERLAESADFMPGCEGGPLFNTTSDSVSLITPQSGMLMQRGSGRVKKSRAKPVMHMATMACKVAPPPTMQKQMRISGAAGAPAKPPASASSVASRPTQVQHAAVDSVVVSMPQGEGAETHPSALDFTSIPKQLDSLFDKHDSDSSIRATILETGRPWKRMRQDNLLSKAKQSRLNKDDCKSEMDKAFDLLDALSRSGALPIAFAELHVIVAVTHCFENDVMGTVVQDNVNPIEKVEKSTLMVASTIQGEHAQELIGAGPDLQRLTDMFPRLIEGGGGPAIEG
eukprot:CAMPEP_0119005492 /NCGR_PEP_ID=MMETSP1176-20130426/1748_1 /TAXON_ID=265551 /ORGANISM="Synedropsis recta cf, Strain CCMP1620" /LENGTH=988 /DNA_ID=CAMNT_0006957305 /DNA_START=85 /DNA_END=3051 /DNA_ORIENTATION=+